MTNWSEHYDVLIPGEPRPRRRTSKPVYQTALGSMYCGMSEKVLKSTRLQGLHGQAQLVFTSPPFPLNTKKRYGNLQGDEYIMWCSRSDFRSSTAAATGSWTNFMWCRTRAGGRRLGGVEVRHERGADAGFARAPPRGYAR